MKEEEDEEVRREDHQGLPGAMEEPEESESKMNEPKETETVLLDENPSRLCFANVQA